MPTPLPSSNISIQTATQNDFSWIADKLKRSGSGFFGNLVIIEDHLNKGQLLVAKSDNAIVGFLSYGDNLSPCIMEVWKGQRKLGIGRHLYDGFVAATQNKRGSADVMEILCQPSSSMAFWAKMGFQKQYDENGSKNRMFKLVVKPELFRRYEDIRLDIYLPGKDPIFSAVEDAEININKDTLDIFLRQPLIFYYQGSSFDKSDMIVCVSSVTTGETLFKDYLLSENAKDIGINAKDKNLDLFVFSGFEIHKELIYKPEPTTKNNHGLI